MKRTPTIAPAELVLNFDIYPRHQIDPENRRRITTARQSGVRLPPVVAWWKTKWVIDGFHRIDDALEHESTAVRVVWRDYPNEAAAFADAVRLNAHGRQLSAYDQTRCILIGERLRLDDALLASALGMTVERLADLKMTKTAIDPEAKLMPIKRTLGPWAGRQLTETQVSGNKKAGGMNALFYVNQVCNLIESDLIDRDNENLMAGLARLRGLLAGCLKRQAG